MSKQLKCVICNKEFKVYGKRENTAKCCSKECMGLYFRAEKNTECTSCGSKFHIKESQKKRYKRTQGYFCSTKCVADFRKKEYLGDKNPNFRKDVNTDYDGYMITYLPKFGRIKLHHMVVFEILNIDRIPKGYHVHHRDCDINNNEPQNLVILSISDHKWVHKQFGSATLWAYYNNKINKNDMRDWCNDKERFDKIIDLNILRQKDNDTL